MFFSAWLFENFLVKYKEVWNKGKHMRKIWLVAVLCLLVCACVGKAPVLHESYRMANGAHRIPVTLNFDSGSGQYWGTYINEYYGDYRLGERNGHPTIYFDTINATRLNRPARLLNPEKAYFDFLYGEKMLSSDGDELVIRNFRGDYIRFKAVN